MRQQDLKRVPGREHYSLKYLQCGRIFSYAHQIDTVISFDPETVLEVGAGGGVVTAALRAVGLHVTTLDVQPELGPDITGSVTQIPCGAEAFDVALCSQVLEHLPFEQFVPALRELRRVTKRGLVLSLPDASKYWNICGKLPKLPPFKFEYHLQRRVPMPVSDGEHYWELGYVGYPIEQIKKEIAAAGWHVSAVWRVPELKWHRFFRLEAV